MKTQKLMKESADVLALADQYALAATTSAVSNKSRPNMTASNSSNKAAKGNQMVNNYLDMSH